MKKRLCLAAALLGLVLAGLALFFRKDPEPETIELWYVLGQVSSPAMEALVEDYNDMRDEAPPVALRAFSGEDELAAALDESRPELLLCSYGRAASLGSRGLLSSIEGLDMGYLDRVEELLPFAGESFFPLGGSVTLIAQWPELSGETIPASAQELMAWALDYHEREGLPYLCLPSGLCPVLSAWSGALGYELKGDLELDGLSARFRSAYGLLASAAQAGALLPPGEDSLDLFLSRQVPCALIGSGAARDLPLDLLVGALPLPEEAGEGYVPDILGLALTGESGSGDFLSYVQGRLEEGYALELGLVPMTERLELTDGSGEDDLSRMLLDYRDCPRLLIHSPLGSYMEQKHRLEQRLGEIFAWLY